MSEAALLTLKITILLSFSISALASCPGLSNCESCSGGVCITCVNGYDIGADCASCLTGYIGANCDSCDTDYFSILIPFTCVHISLAILNC